MKNRSYKSEAMDFIRTLLDKSGNHEEQMKLRSTWWDKDEVNLDEIKQNEESAIKNNGYVYFSYPKHQK